MMGTGAEGGWSAHRVGDVLADRYEILSFLSQGRHGLVVRAMDRVTWEEVAVKVIGPTRAGHMAREFRAARRLDHPNVVRVREFSALPEGDPFIVMDLIDGRSVLEAAREGEPALLLDLARQGLCALEHIHRRGLVHADIKPSNILVTRSDPPRLMILDLSLSSDKEAGVARGTLTHLAPEVRHGASPTVHSDLFGLGLVLGEALTNLPLSPQEEICSEEERCLRLLVERLTNPDPDQRPVSAMEALAVLATGRELILARPAFVGRQEVMRSLEADLRSAWAGLGSTALVVGGPGVGRSRVLIELRALAQLMGGRCIDLSGSHGLPNHLARMAPLPEAPPDDGAYQEMEALARSLIFTAKKTPLLILMDDLHLVSQEVAAYLRYLMARLRGKAILIAGSALVPTGGAMPFWLEEVFHSRLARVHVLHPLKESDLVTATASVLNQEVAKSEAGGWAVQTSLGMPVMLQEALAILVDSGAVRMEAGKWITDARWTEDRFAALPPPRPAQRWATGLVHRLGEPAMRLVAVVALLGGRATKEEAVALLQTEGEVVEMGLRDALALEILEGTEHKEMRFTGPAIRQAVESMVQMRDPVLRERAMKLISRDLSSFPSVERGGALLSLLMEADRPQEAAQAAIVTAGLERLPRRQAELLALAMELDPTVAGAELLLRQAETEAQAGDLSKAVGLYERILDRGDGMGDQALVRAGQVAFQAGQRDLAMGWLQRALETSQSPLVKAEAQAVLGWALAQEENHLQAEKAAKQGLELLERAREEGHLAPTTISKLYGLLAQIHLHDSLWHQAEREAHYALAAARESGDERLRAEAETTLGKVMELNEDFPRAVDAFRTALGLYKRTACVSGQAQCENLVALMLHRLGDWDGAISHWMHFHDLCEALDCPKDSIQAKNSLGALYRDRGHLERAMALFEEALDLSQKRDDRWGEALSRGNLGLALLLAGRGAQAREETQQSYILAQACGREEEILEALSRLVEVALREGRGEEALNLARDGLRLLEGPRTDHRRGRFLRMAGQASFLLREYGHSLGYLDQAMALLRPLGVVHELARVEAVLAQVYEVQGDLNRALRSGMQARAILQRMDARPELAALATILSRLRGYPAPARADGSELELNAILETLEIFTQCSDLDSLLKTVAEQARKLIGVERSFVVLFDDHGEPRLGAANWSFQALPEEGLCHISRSIADRVYQTGKPLVLDEVMEEDVTESIEALGLKRVLCAPIIFQDHYQGLLYLDSRQGQGKSESDNMAILRGLTGIAAAAIENAKLMASLKDRIVMLRTLAHELRNPLTSLEATVDLFRTTRVEDGEELMQLIKRQCGRLNRLTDTVLDCAHLESAFSLDKPSRVDMVDLVGYTVATQRALARAKGLEVRVQVPLSKVMPLLGNPDRLVQILTNLLSNAIKFSPSGQIIDVVVTEGPWHGPPPLGEDNLNWKPRRYDSQAMRVEVRDQGPGVPLVDRETIFLPFRQASNVGTQAKHGNGLGLSISRTIARHHHGDLWMEEAAGGGSCFVLEIPLLAEG